MKATAERIEGCQVVLNVEVDPEELESSLAQAYHHLASRVNIPGFRKGKAPRHVVERHLGREALLDEALEHLIPELYARAIAEQEIEPIAPPQVELAQLDPVTFKATIPVSPTVELGDYQNLRLTQQTVEVSEQQIDEVLEQFRRIHARWEPVDRSAQLGDLLAIDVEGRVGERTVVSDKGRWYHMAPSSPLPIPGFAERLQGMEKGQEQEFTLAIPEDNPDPELAGKECQFQVSVSEVKEEHLPDLDDELARTVGQEVDSVEALRQKAAVDLKASAEARARWDLEDESIDAVAAMSRIEYPAILVSTELERLMEAQRERVGGASGLQDQLKLRGQSEDEFREGLRPLAEKRVLRSLVLDKVSEVEAIEVSDGEVDAEIERLASGESAERVRQLFSSPAARDSLKRELLSKKAMERLVQIATPAPS